MAARREVAAASALPGRDRACRWKRDAEPTWRRDPSSDLVPGSILQAKDATESVLAVETLSAGRKLPLLIEIIDDVNLTVEACNHYRDTPFVSSVAMVGTTNVDRVVAAWVRRGHHSLQAFFTSRPAAVA